MSDENTGHGWLARLAYVALALTIALVLWRRLPERERPTPEPAAQPSADTVPYVPPPEPLSLSIDAPRVIRWCRVLEVIERRCQRCHRTPAAFGAPFPLLTYSDLLQEYPAGTGTTVLRRMSHVVRYRVMPPTHLPIDPPVEPLDAREKDLLLAWLEEGGLALGGEDCPR